MKTLTFFLCVGAGYLIGNTRLVFWQFAIMLILGMVIEFSHRLGNGKRVVE